MGFWSQLFGRNGLPAGQDLQLSPPVAHFSPRVEYLGGGLAEVGESLAEILGLDVREWTAARMWRTQPHLRTVVSFLGRNVAQCGLQVFSRDGEERKRDTKSPLAVALRRPDADMTAYELVYALVVDLALYDVAYWLVAPNSDGAMSFRRLPPAWVTPVPADAFTVASYLVAADGEPVSVPASSVLRFPGFHPRRPNGCSPTIESLKETLQEQIHSSQYRNQSWQNGGRVSGVLNRPVGAPEWTADAQRRFAEDWNAKYTGNGPKAGGTPILQDGMEYTRVDFSPVDQQYIEGVKLAFNTVASAYHVNPTMLGQNDTASYANVSAFNRMLYKDTLGPTFAMIEDRINTFLLPMLGMDPEKYFAEFNIKEKLQGDFTAQALALQSAVGGPYMTRNEARKLENLPPVVGGDDLITPLNVTEGGQASPTDAGSQNVTGADLEPPRPPKSKSAAPALGVGDAAATLAAFFDRQERVVKSRLGAKADSWWDSGRWDSELSAELSRMYVKTATSTGRATLVKSGVAGGEYDEARTLNFLSTVASATAGRINATTRAQIESGIDVGAVFATAKGSRAVQIAQTTQVFAAGFAKVEAAKQQSLQATKTWVAGPDARESHAALDGQTVGIEADFGNGSKWPGDGDDAYNCNCDVTVTLP